MIFNELCSLKLKVLYIFVFCLLDYYIKMKIQAICGNEFQIIEFDSERLSCLYLCSKDIAPLVFRFKWLNTDLLLSIASLEKMRENKIDM